MIADEGQDVYIDDVVEHPLIGLPDEAETDVAVLSKKSHLEGLAEEFEGKKWNPEDYLDDDLLWNVIDVKSPYAARTFSKNQFNGRLPNKVKKKELFDWLLIIKHRKWTPTNKYEAFYRLGAITKTSDGKFYRLGAIVKTPDGEYEIHEEEELKGELGILHLRFRNRTYQPNNNLTSDLVRYVRQDKDGRHAWQFITRPFGKKLEEVTEKEFRDWIISRSRWEPDKRYDSLYRLGAIKKTSEGNYRTLDGLPLEGSLGILNLQFEDRVYNPTKKLTVKLAQYILQNKYDTNARNFIKKWTGKRLPEATEEDLYNVLLGIPKWKRNRWKPKKIYSAIKRLGAPMPIEEYYSELLNFKFLNVGYYVRNLLFPNQKFHEIVRAFKLSEKPEGEEELGYFFRDITFAIGALLQKQKNALMFGPLLHGSVDGKIKAKVDEYVEAYHALARHEGYMK